MDEQQPGNTITPGGGQSEPPANWKFDSKHVAQDSSTPTPPTSSTNAITWSASEYIAHAKSAAWYLLLGLGALALAVLVYFLTHDKISAIAIIVAALFFGAFAARKPRTLNYSLDENGLTIGQKYYGLDQFKTFSTVQEGQFSGILLLPLKRFMPPLEIYYDPKDEGRITDLLMNSLPYEEKKPDPVDKFVRRIRF